MTTACPRPDLLVAAGEGVLPDELAHEVQAHLAGCAICRQLQQDLRDSALAEPTLEELARVRRRVLGGARQPGYWKLGAAAAVVVLAVSGVYLARRPAPQVTPPIGISQKPPIRYRLALNPAPLRLPLTSAMLFRGKEQPANDRYLGELGRALEPYRAGRYAEAVESLATLAGSYPSAVEPPFYLGVSRLLSDDAPGALAALDQARKIGGEALNDDIAWYSAVAAEQSGNWPRAADLLAPLCRAEGLYRAAACEALGQK